MRTYTILLTILGFSCAGALNADVCGTTVGNLVTNCGFETGNFSGWTLSGNLQGGAPPNNYYGVDNSFPNSGTFAGYFGVQGGGGTAVGELGPYLQLSQALALAPDRSYHLQFALSQNAASNLPGYTNHFAAVFNGTTLFSQDNALNSDGFQEYSFNVATGASGAAMLRFDFQNDSDFYRLDDVRLTSASVPEPASFALVIAPLAAAIFLRRRFVR